MPGGYYYEQAHKHDPGLHNWDWQIGDINGEVGHRFYHAVLLMNCQPKGDWDADSYIVSGKLPDGLTFTNSMVIEGIPQERGHWIVVLHVYNVRCNGETYPNFSSNQELRFHISGTGRVFPK